MSYSRFTNSDIYIYPHVSGYIECGSCFLNEPTDEYSLFSVSVQIHDDESLLMHLLQHKICGHKMPDNLAQDILADPDRYGSIS